MELSAYILLAFSTLFVIVDPITLIPVFLAMTPRNTPAERIRMGRLACLVAMVVLVGFALFGNWVFRILGITVTAFQLAGSILLMLVASDMLRARASAVRESDEEKQEGTAKEDIAVTPLGIPLLAGPGAITTVILLHEQAVDFAHRVALLACIVTVCGIAYLCLHLAARGVRLLGPIAMKVATRLMGLLLAAIAMQFLIDAVRVVVKP